MIHSLTVKKQTYVVDISAHHYSGPIAGVDIVYCHASSYEVKICRRHIVDHIAPTATIWISTLDLSN